MGSALVVRNNPNKKMAGMMIRIIEANLASSENDTASAPMTVKVRVKIFLKDRSMKFDTCFTSFTVLVIKVELEKPVLVSFDQSITFSNKSALKSLDIPAVAFVRKYREIIKETILKIVANSISKPR